MGKAESALMQKYQVLCAQLGDAHVRSQAITRQIASLEQQIEAMNAFLPTAKELDKSAETPGDDPAP